MTINEMIAKLETIRAQHGDIEVMFSESDRNLDDFLNQIIKLSLEADSAELRTRATEFYVDVTSCIFSEDGQLSIPFVKLFD